MHEIDATVRAIDRDDLLRVAKHFRRIHSIQRLIEQQVDVLETMTPQEFNQFRDNLNPASGFQSMQFRELEFACGVRRTDVLKYIELDAAQRGRLERRLSEPSLYDHVEGAAAPAGLRDGLDARTCSRAFGRIYSNEAGTTTCTCSSRT